MTTRRCPSCQNRLSPWALECPVCGLTLQRPPLPRPLLFQASALSQRRDSVPSRPQALSAPALGRVTPVTMAEDVPMPHPEERSPAPTLPSPEPAPPTISNDESPNVSLWSLVRMEFLEALTLLLLNVLLASTVCLVVRMSPSVLYPALWTFLVPLHIVVSWAYVMVPLTLTGQTPLMARKGWMLGSVHPEKRLAFSLFHLLGLLLCPFSLISVALQGNRTLAERLTGQELIPIQPSRLRGQGLS